MKDEWEFWNKSLQGEKQSIHEGEPKSGFYRYLNKKKWKAVAIWKKQDSEVICAVNGEHADPLEVWTFCCSNPISHGFYLEAKNNDWNFRDDPVLDNTHAETSKEYKEQIKEYMQMIDMRMDSEKIDKADIDYLAVCAKNINRRIGDLKEICSKETWALKEEISNINKKYKDIIDEADEYCDKVVSKVEEYLINNNLKSAGRTGEKIYLRKSYKRQITSVKDLLDNVREKYEQANDNEEITDAILSLASKLFEKEDPKGIISIEYKKASL